MDSATPRRRRPRADARRNYERLLAEADAVFREHGVDASLERIARQAGVAIGTLYKHFPTRLALIAALLRERHDALFARGDALLADASPGAALATWIRLVVAHAATYQGLAALFIVGPGLKAAELAEDCARLASVTEQLVGTARAAGALRPEVTSADVSALMNAAAWVHEEISADQANRLLDLAVAGMTPTGTALGS
ncbi:TetR/AcrR family transcriptional regulator [Goodfellowiella coeruleoviolacea]|uniref:Transcriptional regulator, TetR family n=1 Tax=Goodfellowiella coeruleoviolacea TaxID=334858 RepID=A0AAE3GG81_9PSEU|nr:TetR family transcriptional regulator [Goodfellowiella coeruleoviolacea]MCP2166739.1 transcriptional regulator, TetR family [Goodfellowiella coeruleoviolacea]